MAAAETYAAHFGTAASSTTPDAEYEFTDLSLRLNEELIEAMGLRGTRSKASERVRQNTRAPGFTITLQPNSVELDTWLPRILGGSESTDSFPLAETLPTFVATFDLVTTRLSLTGCKVNSAVFRSGAGQLLDVTLDVEALDFSTSATAWSTFSLAVSTVGPYIFSDSASGLSIGGSTYQFFSWSLECRNELDLTRFLNSQVRVSLPEQDRKIIWTWDGPHGDNWSGLNAPSSAGVASVAAFTLGGRSLTFTSNKVAYPRPFPVTPMRAEMRLPLSGEARKDGSTEALTTVNDSSA